MKKYILTLLLLYTPIFPTSFIYAPWRHAHKALRGVDTKKECLLPSPEGECFFCKEIKANDNDKYLMLYRSSDIVVQLNPKPYARGSILIYPVEHVMYPQELSPLIWGDMFFMVNQVMQLVGDYFKTDSFSMGMNIGPEATGSNPGHLHLHLVPRMNQPEGFLETCCDTRLIQDDLVKLFKELKKILTGD